MIKILQSVLNTEIPLTNAMGIEVEAYSESGIRLSAPLSKNINHKCTAFGGSLYSVAVLTGWSLIYLLMHEQNLSGHIVIQESKIQYLLPVDTDIISTCSFENQEQVNRFLKVYRRKNKSRISLTVTIEQNFKNAVVFYGQYVVHS